MHWMSKLTQNQTHKIRRIRMYPIIRNYRHASTSYYNTRTTSSIGSKRLRLGVRNSQTKCKPHPSYVIKNYYHDCLAKAQWVGCSERRWGRPLSASWQVIWFQYWRLIMRAKLASLYATQTRQKRRLMCTTGFPIHLFSTMPGRFPKSRNRPMGQFMSFTWIFWFYFRGGSMLGKYQDWSLDCRTARCLRAKSRIAPSP